MLVIIKALFLLLVLSYGIEAADIACTFPENKPKPTNCYLFVIFNILHFWYEFPLSTHNQINPLSPSFHFIHPFYIPVHSKDTKKRTAISPRAVQRIKNLAMNAR